METNAHINTKWSDEEIIDLIRKLRNDLIKDFLDERYLKAYFATHFNIRELSNIKIEFIKKSLKELLIAPVDVFHYKVIVDQVKATDNGTLAEGNEQLCYKELENLFRQFAHLE